MEFGLRILFATTFRYIAFHEADVIALDIQIQSLNALDIGVDLREQYEVLSERFWPLTVVVNFDVMEDAPASGA